ncbi:MAG: DUF760 domain-containing protein [Spirulinaceae cyanobacterium SM2_1_0]|nr:DUF760 domain-containing protein [Spirulinaceae cyanobacterium SM2_1_0]
MSSESKRERRFVDDREAGNQLWQYVKNLSPEAIAQLSKPQSPEVSSIMERNIIGLLGSLPSEHFEVTVTTNREHLGRLLASAIVSGYFLRNAEQRLDFEQRLHNLDGDRSE